MKSSNISLYIDFACRLAEESKARRLKVGAIIVNNDRVISMGCNGTKVGADNNCEDEILVTDKKLISELKERCKNYSFLFDLTIPFGGTVYIRKIEPVLVNEAECLQAFQTTFALGEKFYELVTRPTVIHAEANALNRICKSHESSDGASMFMSHSPCLPCSMNIQLAGIKELYYVDKYRTTEGIDYLMDSGVKVEHITKN